MNPVDPNEVTRPVPNASMPEPAIVPDPAGVPERAAAGEPGAVPDAGSASRTVWTPPAATPEPSPASSAASQPGTVEPLTPPVYESTLAWAPAQPVVKDTKPRRRRGSVRWAAALAVVVLVLGASAAVAALLVGQSPNATILGYVPDKSVMYGELRLDLPGDQRQAVGQFLSKFPGFADQAALETKLDEVLDQLVDDATTGEQSYTTDIKPWFSGELGVSVGPLPDASKLTSEASAMDAFRGIVLLSVKDPALAQAWFDAAFQKAGATTTNETYNGATLTLLSAPDTKDGPKAAFAIVDGKVAVIGDETSVKAAVDTNGNSGFADLPGPKSALDAADGDHIGFVYVALRDLATWSKGASGALSEGTGAAATTAISESMLELLPEWGAYWLSVESDALVMEAVNPQPAKSTVKSDDRASTIVDHVPASAIGVAIANDYGKSVEAGLELYESDPAFKEIYDSLEQALGLLGGTESALGWIGDSAVVLNVADGTPEGGLIVQPTNAEDAKRFLTSIKTLVGLGGSQIGASLREETYNGVTITVVDLGKLGELAGKTGMPPVKDLPAGDIEIAYAAPTTSSSSARARRSSSTSSTPPGTPRLVETTGTARSRTGPARVRHRPSWTSPRSAASSRTRWPRKIRRSSPSTRRTSSHI